MVRRNVLPVIRHHRIYYILRLVSRKLIAVLCYSTMCAMHDPSRPRLQTFRLAHAGPGFQDRKGEVPEWEGHGRSQLTNTSGE